MIISLIEILELPNLLELPNFGLQNNLSHVIKLSWLRHGWKLWRHTITLITFIIRRPRVAIFSDIIKIVTIFIKKIFKDSKVKKN